jgi:hypothetical protein
LKIADEIEKKLGVSPGEALAWFRDIAKQRVVS